jgi:hypothetical protein
VAYRVDTAMEAMKVKGLHRTVERAPRHAALEELPDRDDTVLPPRKPGDHLLHRVWAVFSTVFVDKSAHRPRVAGRALRQGSCL